MDKQTLFRLLLIIAAAFVLFLLIGFYNRNRASTAAGGGGAPYERFTAAPATVQATPAPSGGGALLAPAVSTVRAVEPLSNEQYRPVEHGTGPKTIKDCYPKDRLTTSDLLPKDAANSKWAQANPAGQGDVKDQNFLTAGYMVGINTVGQTLRNANMQLRSEPPNPQFKVSPWMQTTIEPDVNRRPLEIGADC